MTAPGFHRAIVGAAVLWVAIAALFVTTPGPAAAGCRQVCTQGSDCDQLSGDQRWRCIRGPSSGGCRTVCRDAHGAIAYSRATGAYGYAFDQDSAARAERVARGACAKRAGASQDCRVVVAAIDRCIAIAAASGREAHAATAATRREAEQQSLAACRARDGGACESLAWTCSK